MRKKSTISVHTSIRVVKSTWNWSGHSPKLYILQIKQSFQNFRKILFSENFDVLAKRRKTRILWVIRFIFALKWIVTRRYGNVYEARSALGPSNTKDSVQHYLSIENRWFAKLSLTHFNPRLMRKKSTISVHTSIRVV